MDIHYRERKLRGVGGWLMLFCLSLTLVLPISHFRIAYLAFKSLTHPVYLAQSTVVRLSVVIVIYSGLAIFSCYCGYLLWSEDARGPRVTKAFLIIGASFVIVLNSVLALGGLQIDLFPIVIQRLVYAVCWYAYLATSKRVRLTYSTDPFTAMPSPSSPEAGSQ